MSDRPHDTLQAVLAELRDLRRLVRDLRRPGRADERRLLSKRAAARRLGIDRTTTLADLIADGRLATVPWGDTVRIPLSEVERVEAEGISPTPSRGKSDPAPSSPRRGPDLSPRGERRRVATRGRGAARSILKIPLE